MEADVRDLLNKTLNRIGDRETKLTQLRIDTRVAESELLQLRMYKDELQDILQKSKGPNAR